jgi:hypothetical protein
MLLVLRPGLQARAAPRQSGAVAQSQVQGQIFESGFYLGRAHGQHHGHDAGMPLAQHGRKAREHGHGRGHGGHAQLAAQRSCCSAQFLAQTFLCAQHGQSRGQHLLALGRETRKRPPPAHDDGTELVLQRLERIGQCRLRDMAGLRRPCEMAVLVERHQITHGGQKVHQVLLLTVIVGNLLEKSLALRATFTARSRATFL